MRGIWMRSISLALVASLAALPAMAGGHEHGRGCGHGHGGHGYGHGHGHSREGDWDGDEGWGYPAYGYPQQQHHHHHRGVDKQDVLLALGVTAVGLSALTLWTQAQRSSP